MKWIALVALWLAAIGLLAVWLGRTTTEVLRDQLRHLHFWSIELLLALAATAFIACSRDLVRSLTVPRRGWLVPVVASGLAALLAGGVAPRTSRIYYDEQIYESVGRNLSDLRLAQMCNEGTVEYGILQCQRGEYNKQPYGYPHLLGMAYRIAGVHERLAHDLNVAAAGLLVWVVFLTTTAWFRDWLAGSLAALIAALIPQQLLWANTAASEPSAALAAALAVLAAVHFTQIHSTWALLWAVIAASLAVQFRTESILVVPVVLLAIALGRPEEMRRARFWWAGLLGLILCAPHLAHFVAVRNEAWGATAERMSLDYFVTNVRTNGWFYLWDSRFPAAYTLLALVGVVAARGRAALVAFVYFALFWGIFLFFYAGSYNYGADVRFSLMTYPPLAMLAGVGAAALVSMLQRALPSLTHRVVAIAALIALQFLWYLPLVRAVGEEAWAARADVAFARNVAATLPPDAIVLTHNPSMFLVWGVNAAQLSIATTEPRYVIDGLARRYSGGVFVHWSFWCNVADPAQRAFCLDALNGFESELLREARARDYRYAFYRLRFTQAAEQGGLK